MPAASLALRTSNVTSANANVELQPQSVAVRVLEIGIFQAAATASSYGIGRPAAIGVTPGTQSTFRRDDPNLAAPTCKAGLTWGTSPTAPSPYHRLWNSAAAVSGIVFTFPRVNFHDFGAIVVAPGGNLVIFNITASVVCDVHFAIDE